MPRCKAAIVSGGLLAVAAGFAVADPVTVRNDVAVHAGPGASFTVIGHVPSGGTLELSDCTARWCQVYANGIAGFVGAADLGIGPGRLAPSTTENSRRSRTRVTRRPAAVSSSTRSVPPGEDSDLLVDPVQPSATTRSTHPY
jgi:hypothetical protein